MAAEAEQEQTVDDEPQAYTPTDEELLEGDFIDPEWCGVYYEHDGEIINTFASNPTTATLSSSAGGVIVGWAYSDTRKQAGTSGSYSMGSWSNNLPLGTSTTLIFFNHDVSFYGASNIYPAMCWMTSTQHMMLSIPDTSGSKTVKIGGTIDLNFVYSIKNTNQTSAKTTTQYISSAVLYGITGSGQQKIDDLTVVNNKVFFTGAGKTYDIEGFQGIRIQLSIPMSYTTNGMFLANNNSGANAKMTLNFTPSLRIVFSDSDMPVDISGVESGVGDINSGVQETNGLLSGLIQWVQGIYNSVTSFPQHFTEIIDNIKSIGTTLASLPQTIINLFIDAVKGLFIPSEEELTELMDNLNEVLKAKLGILWQTVDIFNQMIDGFIVAFDTNATATIPFPGIAVPMPDGTQQVILPEQDVSLNNKYITTLQAPIGTLVTIMAFCALVMHLPRMAYAIISGVSYYEFLTSGDALEYSQRAWENRNEARFAERFRR